MTANSIRSFAAGIILASSVCGAVYFLQPDEEAVMQAEEVEIETEDVGRDAEVEVPTLEEIKGMLTYEGYVIHSEEEWEEHLASFEQEGEVEEKVVYRTMLSVTSGMTSIDVGRALERANIIDSAIDFFYEIENRGLESKLRPGTYEVESAMNLNEIISTIFK